MSHHDPHVPYPLDETASEPADGNRTLCGACGQTITYVHAELAHHWTHDVYGPDTHQATPVPEWTEPPADPMPGPGWIQAYQNLARHVYELLHTRDHGNPSGAPASDRDLMDELDGAYDTFLAATGQDFRPTRELYAHEQDGGQ